MCHFHFKLFLNLNSVVLMIGNKEYLNNLTSVKSVFMLIVLEFLFLMPTHIVVMTGLGKQYLFQSLQCLGMKNKVANFRTMYSGVQRLCNLQTAT